MRWLARLEVAGVEPLGLALGFGRRATYSHLARLADAGLVARGYDRDGSVVAITAAGRRAIGADRGDVRAGATHGSGLRHARAVSWVAALLSVRGRVWVSEHEFRHDEAWQVPVVWASSRGRHRPDLGVVMGASRVAVEVELSHKAPRRLHAILSGHVEAIAVNQQAAALAHALVRLDHHDDDPQLDYATEELVAESVAYTVCGFLGLDTAQNSIAYLAVWSEQTEADAFERIAALVDRLARRLEDALQPDDTEGAAGAAVNDTV